MTGLPRALHRLEPLAPDWLVSIVRPKPAPVPWTAMVRYAITIGGALAAGVLTGQVALGGLLATGALTAAFGDQGGPMADRLRRIAAGCATALVGLVLGRVLLGEVGVLGVLLVAGAGVASAYLSAISAVASFAGLQLLVNIAVSAGLGAQVPLPLLLGGFAAGAAWATLLTVVTALVRPEAGGPRDAVATMLDRLGDYLAAAQERRDLRQPRAALATALTDAWDVVTAARSVAPGQRQDLHRLAAVIGPAAELARAAAADPSGTDDLIGRVAALRTVVAGTRGARVVGGGSVGAAAAAVARMEEAAGGRSAPTGSRPQRRRHAGVRERLTGRRTALFAVRIALCLAVAETLRAVLPLTHPYWLLLTVAVVLKPDLGSVFARGLQRTAGTLVGVVIGSGILALVPPGPLLLVPVVLLAIGFPFAAKRNYGMLATFITPLVLILVDLAGAPTTGLATGRLLDTVLGAAIVLLIGYLPWPSTWRPRLGSAVATAVGAVAAYAAVAVDHDDRPAGPARRRAFAAVQDVRADLQAALSEPPPGSRYAAAWWPVMSALEQVADGLRAADLIGSTADRRRADSTQVSAALTELREAMEARRPPAALPLPDDGPLAPVAQDVAALRGLLAGPVELPRRSARRP